MVKSKVATCWRAVPASVSPSDAVIEVGTKLAYTRIFFYNGEHYLALKIGGRVPAIFFDIPEDEDSVD